MRPKGGAIEWRTRENANERHGGVRAFKNWIFCLVGETLGRVWSFYLFIFKDNYCRLLLYF